MNINPALYHLHHADESEDIPFWLELAEELGDAILELGCGTGRVLLPLAGVGHRMVGLDIDLGMLAFLRAQLPPPTLNRVILFQADLAAFHLKRSFAVIFLACNTLSTMTKELRQRAYTCVHKHLAEGGIFAASMPNPVQLERLARIGAPEIEANFNHPQSGNPLQISSEWERFDQTLTIRWHYDHLIPDGQVERETIEIKHHLTSLEEYLDEMERAQLLPENIYGEFDKTPYQEDATHLIILARKTRRI